MITPCLIFTRIYETPLSWQNNGLFSLFSLAVIVTMGIVGFALSRARRFSPSMQAAFLLSVMMCNSGNYALPVIELMFNGDAYATSVQVIVMVTQGIVHFTFGIFLLSRGKHSFRESVKNTFRYPVIYAVVVAFVFKGFEIPAWAPAWVVMEKISQAFVSVALFTLGAQLARFRLGRGLTNVIIAVATRLVFTPLAAFLIIKLFGFSGVTAQVMFVGASMPSAVNSALLAAELKNEPEFASQAVFFSTLFSFVTVSVAIWIARMWIG